MAAKTDKKVARAQPSRKGPKAWRKNINITDVEEHLEQTRKDAMAGGAVERKPDDSLFVVDTRGADKTGRTRAAVKPLRIDQILGERTAIHALGKDVYARAADVSVSTKKSTALSPSTLKAVRKMTDKVRPVKTRRNHVEVSSTSDIWADGAECSPAAVKKPASVCKLNPVALTVPAVDVAHPGTSYNPSPTDLKDAIDVAYQQEIERQQTSDPADSRSTQKSILLAAQRQPLHTTMEVDLPSDDDGEDTNSDEDTEGGRQPTLNRRKTKRDRKKDEEQRQRRLELAAARAAKQLDSQLCRLKSITAQVADEQSRREARAAERLRRITHAKQTQTARLSQHSYTPLPMPIKLSDELTESLRQLKPETNLFKDRFNNMQKRNLIEARVPVSTRRRYQLKDFEKHTYKRFQ